MPNSDSREEHFRKLERAYATAPVNAYFRPELRLAVGTAEIRIPVRQEFLHAAGAVHGSIYFKALDDAAFFAAQSMVEDVFLVTASFHLHFLKAVTSGALTARGRLISQSRNLYVAEAVVVDDDEHEVARGSGDFVRSRIELNASVGYV